MNIQIQKHTARLGLIVIVCLIVGFACSKEEATANRSKIDLCDYGSHNFDEVNATFKGRVLGKKNSDVNILKLISNTPAQAPNKQEMYEYNQRISGIPVGILYHFVFLCSLPANNRNMWRINILKSKAGIVEIAELRLLYDDENFYQRHEDIKASNYGYYKEAFIKAVRSLTKEKQYDRLQLKKAMVDGGFIFHRSCESDDMTTDIFIVPLPPPESVGGLLAVAYFNPNPPPGVAVSFSKSDRKFLNARQGWNPDPNKCSVVGRLAYKQVLRLFIKKYPESWYSNRLLKSKEFMESLNEEGY